MRIETLAPVYTKDEVKECLVKTSMNLIAGDEINEEEREVWWIGQKCEFVIPFELNETRYYVRESDLDISRQDPPMGEMDRRRNAK